MEKNNKDKRLFLRLRGGLAQTGQRLSLIHICWWRGEMGDGMERYKCTIAEAITFKQFVCEVFADTEIAARAKAKAEFDAAFPIYSAQARVIMCSKVF